MNEIKKLSNIDLLALIRTVSLELENRECEGKGKVTKYVAREIPSTVKVLKLSALRKGDKVKFIGPQNAYPGSNITVGNVYEIIEVVEADYVVFVGDNGSQTTRQIIQEEDVHLFEKVEVDSPQIIKSPNQQRAELIQRAREFVDGQRNKVHDSYIIERKNGDQLLCDAKFIHDLAKRTTTCTLMGLGTGYTRKKSIVRCHPNEVFNGPLGEVVSLCMALQIDIPQEFIDAVQPVEKVIGMVVIAEEHTDGEHILIASGETLRNGYAHIGSPVGKDGKIIDDTNAEYEFECVGE